MPRTVLATLQLTLSLTIKRGELSSSCFLSLVTIYLAKQHHQRSLRQKHKIMNNLSRLKHASFQIKENTLFQGLSIQSLI